MVTGMQNIKEYFDCFLFFKKEGHAQSLVAMTTPNSDALQSIVDMGQRLMVEPQIVIKSIGAHQVENAGAKLANQISAGLIG